MSKIQANHLGRQALIYVRQSTLTQVRENLGSQERQYDLVRRALDLGWAKEQIAVIDQDQGRSGASIEGRDGFQQLVADVGMGHAGAVFSLEASRLARSWVDWYQLLEICALTHTLVVDEESVYDPSHYNDRLLLGFKGTMSEAELHWLRSRLNGGRLKKAESGELRIDLPTGLVYSKAGKIVLDPDEAVQQAIQLLFDTFASAGSARAVVRHFRQHELRFPTRELRGPRKGELRWQRLKPSKTRIVHTLDKHNGQVGFDFLGFHIRQHRVGQYHTRTFRGVPGYRTIIKPSWEAQKRHLKRVKEIVRQHRGSPQAALIKDLNPAIRGWTRYYRTCTAKKIFARMDLLLIHKLQQWAKFRHSWKSLGWRYRRYWQQRRNAMFFTDGSTCLVKNATTKIERHTKVISAKSPYDGDWLYWGARLSKTPVYPKRKTTLLKQQRGKCPHCGLRFMDGSVLEVHHRNGDKNDSRYDNLLLLHGHCHDEVHG